VYFYAEHLKLWLARTQTAGWSLPTSRIIHRHLFQAFECPDRAEPTRSKPEIFLELCISLKTPNVYFSCLQYILMQCIERRSQRMPRSPSTARRLWGTDSGRCGKLQTDQCISSNPSTMYLPTYCRCAEIGTIAYPSPIDRLHRGIDASWKFDRWAGVARIVYYSCHWWAEADGSIHWPIFCHVPKSS
jgi:hypothetical protein